MATDLLLCCEREDGSKYWHKCACPQATFNCESETLALGLCGWVEAEDPPGIVPSTPPKKYRQLSIAFSGSKTLGPFDCYGESYNSFDSVWSGSATQTTNTLTCVATSNTSGKNTTETCRCNTFTELVECNTEITDLFTTPLDFNQWWWILDTVNSTTSGVYEVDEGDPIDTRQAAITASVEDTEADAETRATPQVGTLCSSRWETRNSQFDWIKRTSGYKIECSALVVGIEYRVTPSIRKRTAQDDGSGTWEDVTVTPVDFTATSDTETIDDAGDFIELDHIQGWEYEITAVNIEKKA